MAKKSNGKPAGPKHTEATELTGRIGYSELIDDVCDLVSSSTEHNLTKAQIADVVRSTFGVLVMLWPRRKLCPSTTCSYSNPSTGNQGREGTHKNLVR